MHAYELTQGASGSTRNRTLAPNASQQKQICNTECRQADRQQSLTKQCVGAPGAGGRLAASEAWREGGGVCLAEGAVLGRPACPPGLPAAASHKRHRSAAWHNRLRTVTGRALLVDAPMD